MYIDICKIFEEKLPIVFIKDHKDSWYGKVLVINSEVQENDKTIILREISSCTIRCFFIDEILLLVQK